MIAGAMSPDEAWAEGSFLTRPVRSRHRMRARWHKVGDEVEVETPAGVVKLTVTKIS